MQEVHETDIFREGHARGRRLLRETKVNVSANNSYMNVQVLEDLERRDTYLLVFATVMMVGREAREGGLPRLARRRARRAPLLLTSSTTTTAYPPTSPRSRNTAR